MSYRRAAAKNARGEKVEGVYVVITDWNSLNVTELNFHMMRLACQWGGKGAFANASNSQESLFNKHTGSAEWWGEISRKGSAADVGKFVEKWKRRPPPSARAPRNSICTNRRARCAAARVSGRRKIGKENAMDKKSAIFTRRSVRAYDSSRRATKEQIIDLLDAAMHAPSAMNKQPWEFIAVTDPDRIAG